MRGAKEKCDIPTTFLLSAKCCRSPRDTNMTQEYRSAKELPVHTGTCTCRSLHTATCTCIYELVLGARVTCTVGLQKDSIYKLVLGARVTCTIGLQKTLNMEVQTLSYPVQCTCSIVHTNLHILYCTTCSTINSTSIKRDRSRSTGRSTGVHSRSTCTFTSSTTPPPH